MPRLKIRNIAAFFILETKDWLKYKYEVTAWIVQVVIGAVTYSYVGRNLTLQVSEALSQYGGNFLAFLIVGLAFNDFIVASMNAPRSIINPWNLEWLLTIPASLSEAIIGSVWFRYTLSLFQVAAYLGFASLSGVDFSINLPAVIVVLALGMVSMFGFGLISAGIQVITKRWDPVIWIFNSLGWLLSGVWFPPELLPSFLRPLSGLIPQTYILKMLRLAVITGSSLPGMLDSLLRLAALSLIVLPAGFLFFRFGIETSKRHGTLGYY